MSTNDPTASRQPTDAAADAFIGRWLQFTFKLVDRFKWWLASIGATVGGVYAVLTFAAGLEEWHRWCLIAAFLPAVVALLFNAIPEAWNLYREWKMKGWVINPTEAAPGYFRLSPWDEQDYGKFSRPDGAERRVRDWLLNSCEPLVYLTGVSGTGKSSLLNSYVIPELQKHPQKPVESLTVRSFDNTLQELKEALLSSTRWSVSDAMKRKRSLRLILEEVCEILQQKETPRRLLLVLDQFEELLILHEAETADTNGEANESVDTSDGTDSRRSHVEDVGKFLQELLKKPIEGLTILLTFRSDYQHLLLRLELPLQNSGRNWEDVGAFTCAEAQRFWQAPGAGLDLGKEVMRATLVEASVVDDVRGLVRPIVMNMLGRVLQERAGLPAAKHEPGTLLSGYLRRCLQSAQWAEKLPAVLQQLVYMDAGTKRPRSVGQISQATGIDAHTVEGSLMEFNELGLVRRLTREPVVRSRQWEISHDFIARLLVPILQSPRQTLWQKLRPALAPITLVLWLVMFPYLIWNQIAGDRTLIQAQLSNLGVTVERIENGDTWRAKVSNKSITSFRKQIELLIRHSDIADLYLTSCDQLTSLDVSGLTSLKTLDLTFCGQLTSVDVSGLTSLKTLYLTSCDQLTSVDVSGLTSLKTLDLNECDQLTSVDVSGLTSLKTLETLHWIGIDSLENLPKLNRLRRINISAPYHSVFDRVPTKLSNFKPLAQFPNLSVIYAMGLTEQQLNSLRAAVQPTVSVLTDTEYYSTLYREH